jgi:hypothetical protein
MAKHKHAISEKPLRPGRKAAGSGTRRVSQVHGVVAAEMSRSRKCLLFCAWFGLLSALWLFAGMPIDTFRGGDRLAGFPLQFVVWRAGVLAEFQGWKLCFDIGIGLVSVLGGSWICVKSASTKRPISNVPKDPVLVGAILLVLALFFSPTYFAFVDYNQGYLGSLAGLYPEAKPVERRDPRFPLKKD